MVYRICLRCDMKIQVFEQFKDCRWEYNSRDT